MQTTLKLTARVQPGKRVEFTAPELTEGEDVEITVGPVNSANKTHGRIFASAADYLRSLPPVRRTAEEWVQVERELREAKAGWDR